MMLRAAGGLLLILCGSCCGCSRAERQAGDVVERAGQPAVHYVEDDDDRMNAAMAHAKDTVQQFIAALNRPAPGQTAFSVKMAIGAGDDVEFVWLLPVRHEGENFIGTLNNDPDVVGSAKLGDELTVAQGEISDWMYLEDSRLVGGFTLRVLRDEMSPEERAEFDRGLPFTID